MKKFPRRVRDAIGRRMRALAKVVRNGGVTHVTVAQILHGSTLRNRKILITGGGSGIGLAIARKCISEGAQVLITGRSGARLEDARARLASPSVHVLVWDIADVSSIEARIEDVKKIFGSLPDALVNNAGVLIAESEFPSITERVWDETYAVNSKGLFFLTQSIVRDWLGASRGGKIINIASTGGVLAADNPYRMTKWDVIGLTQALGAKLSPHGIIVNGIAPGRTATEMLSVDPAGNLADSRQPVRRFALPEEIAELAGFMLSDACNYIVGQTIVCDGGYTLKIN